MVGIVAAQQLFDRLLAEGGNIVAGFGGQPAGKLLDAVGVLQSGKLDGLVGELRADGFAQLQRALAEVHIDRHAARVDKQVGFPLLLNEIWHGEHRQAAFDLHFRHNVLAVVGLKQRPFFGVVMRIISGSAAVCLCWLTGHTKIADQSLAGSQLLFVLRNAQRPACRVQTCGVTGIQAVQHRVTPL